MSANLMHSVHQIFECSSACPSDTGQFDYCCERAAPDEDQKYFACRKEKAVCLNHICWGDAANWFQYGKLIENNSKFSSSSNFLTS